MQVGPQKAQLTPIRVRRLSAVTILVAIVMLLVPALAWMQYQWLGQLSTAERDRMQRTLRTAAAQFATEFDSEISRTLVGLQLDGQTVRDQNWTRYAQQYSRWATSANEPRLVRDVWVVDTMPGTPLPAFDSSDAVPVDRLRLRKWNVQSLSFEDAAWPEDLLKVRDSLAGRFIGLQVSGGNRRAQSAIEHREPPTVPLTAVDDNILISPVTLFEIPDRPSTPKISILGFTILRLDPVVIRDTILSSLAARHFHGDDAEADYRVAVVEREDPTKVIWESEPGVSAVIAAAPDVSQSFMGPRPDQMFVFARNLRGDTTTQTAALTLPAPPPPPPPPGNREPGTGSRETQSSSGSREPGTGSREPGTGSHGAWVARSCP